jgi:glutathione S-transferase
MTELLDEDVKTREVLAWQGVHLLHFRGSSCSQKTRIFLNLKGVDWVPHHVDLGRQANYEPWFLGINPRGLVPVLVHDGVVHIESNDILALLEETFPEPKLIPEGGWDEALRLLAEEDDLHLDVRTLTMRFVIPKALAQKRSRSLDTYERDPGTVGGRPDSHKQVELEFWQNFSRHGITDTQARTSALRFRRIYERFEDLFQEDSYLMGPELSVVDIAWFIYTHRLSDAGYPFASLHPNVHRWYRSLLDHEAFAKEIRSPLPLRVITAGLHALQSARGRTLARVADLRDA